MKKTKFKRKSNARHREFLLSGKYKPRVVADKTQFKRNPKHRKQETE